MKKTLVLIVFLALAFLFATPALCLGDSYDWDSSPYNWKNNPYNWDNNPNNWNNNKYNWDNSPYKYGNERIIRDNQGRARGYAVPKADGGVNIFDLRGRRRGYTP